MNFIFDLLAFGISIFALVLHFVTRTYWSRKMAFFLVREKMLCDRNLTEEELVDQLSGNQTGVYVSVRHVRQSYAFYSNLLDGVNDDGRP